jgi:hypothetical protein
VGGFEAAVVFWVEAAGAGLVFVFEKEDAVDDGDAGFDLELGEGVGDADGDVVGMGGGAAEDGAEADDGVVLVGAGEAAGDGRDFEGAGDANDFEGGGAFEFSFGEFDEGVGEFGVVASGHDGEAAAGGGGSGRSDFLQHGVAKRERWEIFKLKWAAWRKAVPHPGPLPRGEGEEMGI